jgi:GTP cyclohydrolase I
MDKEKIKKCVREILKEIGEDVNREGIQATPDRVARMYENLYYRYVKKLIVMNEKTRNNKIDKDVVPITIFKNESKEMLIRSVEFVSTCEHHNIPFRGKAFIGIIPNKYLLGMNKIDKIVKYFAAGLQIQERLTKEVADWIEKNIKPIGVIVIIKAEHFCAICQGDNGWFTTSAVRGEFFKPNLKKGNPREEFLQLIAHELGEVK